MNVKLKLKIVYSILKEFSEGNMNINHENYDIEYGEFITILEFMQNEELIRGASFAHTKTEPTIGWWDDAEVTMKGLEYLNNNSTLAKGYKTIKEIRDWLKL